MRRQARRRTKGSSFMTNDKQPRRAVAAIAVFSLLIQPTAPLVLAAGSLGQTATKPAAPSQQTPPKPATPAGATAPAGRGLRRDHLDTTRWRLAAYLRSAERRQHPHVPAAGRDLGQAGAHRRLQRRVVSDEDRREAGARHRQARGGYEGRPDRSAGELPEHEDRRGEFSNAGEGAGPRDYGTD